MKRVLILILLFSSHPVLADLDYRAGVDIGSMSYWTNATASVGYGVVIWGEDPFKSLPEDGFARPDQYPWNFGYLRPEIKVESSAFRNALAMDLELSPISWIILGVGKTYEHRSDNGRYDYDCKVASCYGGLERSRFTFGGFPIAVGPLFIGGFMRREWIDSQDSGNRDFVEQISGLVGKTASDRLQSDAILAGFVLSEKWILGGGSINDAFEKSGEEARLNFASINYYQGKISISLTAGQRKRSTQENEEFWSHFSLKWVGKRGLWP